MGPFYRKLLAQETGRGSRKDNSLHCSSLAPFIIMLASALSFLLSGVVICRRSLFSSAFPGHVLRRRQRMGNQARRAARCWACEWHQVPTLLLQRGAAGLQTAGTRGATARAVAKLPPRDSGSEVANIFQDASYSRTAFSVEAPASCGVHEMLLEPWAHDRCPPRAQNANECAASAVGEGSSERQPDLRIRAGEATRLLPVPEPPPR